MLGNHAPAALVLCLLLVACDPPASAPAGPGLATIEAGRFELEDQATWEANGALVERLARDLPVAGPADLAGDLNRTGRRVHAIDGLGVPLRFGFGWDAGDTDVESWYPQGVTGSADAGAGGTWGGRRWVLASWYYKKDVAGTAYGKGVRVSFADLTDPDRIRYRQVLLVEPYEDGGAPTFRAIPIHAGGIVWYGDRLYVADTSVGLRVFAVDRILRVGPGKDDAIGRDPAGGRYHAYGYRYVLPQIGRYALSAASQPARFSFVSLDRSTTPASLLTGEYDKDSVEGRLFRWTLDPRTGRLAAPGGRVQPVAAFETGQTRVQGALSWRGSYWLSSSSQVGSRGALYRTRPGVPSVAYAWPRGPEDLYHEVGAGLLWSLTEHPSERFVFAAGIDDVSR